MMDILSELNTASFVVGNLPELSGFNGSILLLDDTEAKRIEKCLIDAINEITNLRALKE
jgi:hypothetical protein